MTDEPPEKRTEGTDSGLAATVEALEPVTDPAAAALEIDPTQRYDELDLLGEGGMGEVHACRDRVVGRIIARKVARMGPGGRALRTEARAQFLREARVQGQLEHPAIVPVYDVGRDAHGRIFFTMKRVSGQTLASVLATLRDGDAQSRQGLGRHRLLTAFQLVCHCIEYAHARGVVHRDLKPDNIMFGDFGEVYVLDWGVARVGRPLGDAQLPVAVPDTPSGVGGTPGYMAPEQLATVTPLDARMDVYALGAILFEMLTLEPLHAGEHTRDLVASTQRGADARASRRCPEREVPPELEAICVRATAQSPDDRYPTVRELSADVERFLEGHRNMELRRDISTRHLEEAREQKERALRGGPGALEARSAALGEIGRALTLTPDRPEATELLRELLASPPRTLPPEAQAAIEAEQSEEGRAASLLGGWIFAIMTLGSVAATVVVEVTDPVGLAVFLSAALLASILGFANVRRARDGVGILIVVLAAVAIAGSSGALGPLVLTPILALALAIISMNLGRLVRFRALFLAIACMAVLVPAVLEMTGVVPSSYVNQDGSWLIRSRAALAPVDRAYPFGLLGGSLLTIVASSLFVWRMSERINSLRRALQLHAWHLSQLVPEQARDASADGASIAPPR